MCERAEVPRRKSVDDFIGQYGDLELDSLYLTTRGRRVTAQRWGIVSLMCMTDHVTFSMYGAIQKICHTWTGQGVRWDVIKCDRGGEEISRLWNIFIALLS